MQTTTTTTEVKIYVGTYAKYNEGSIYGEWLTLSDYSDLDEFYKACRELHADEEDPEFMFQDFEAAEELEAFISESYISPDIFKAMEVLEEIENDLIGCWNEYCSETNRDNQFFDFDDDFFDTYFDGRPMDAARATYFGDVNWSHNYISFDGYGNLKSFSDPEEFIDKDELLQWMIER